MEFWGITNSGKVRKYNQDFFKMQSSEDKGVAVLVVCDGMGGANAGNVASELAAEVFIENMSHLMDDNEDLSDQSKISAMVTDAVLAANTAVFDKSLQDEEYAGMGTTLTAAVSSGDGEVVANIGDSRLYHITKSGITQITKDHSVVEKMIEKGEITRHEARFHPSRNLITRALGTSFYEPPDIFFIDLKTDEFILLCSDGLSNVVLEDEMFIEFKDDNTVRSICEVLVDKALERGAPDNVTAVILKK